MAGDGLIVAGVRERRRVISEPFGHDPATCAGHLKEIGDRH